MADYIETGDNDNAIEEEMHGDLHTRDDDNYNISPHTTTNSTSVDQSQQTLPQDTAATTPLERPLPNQRSANGHHGGHQAI